LPRNPKAVAIERAKKAAVNLAKAEEAVLLLRRRRADAMRDMLEAGVTVTEIARTFYVSRVTTYDILGQKEQGAA
jgi:DNA invertase Pin-like site-specific DNA recombinase